MNSTETIAEIVADLDEYKTAGERPSKEDVWALGQRIQAASTRAVLAERERCAGVAESLRAKGGNQAQAIADAIRSGAPAPVDARPWGRCVTCGAAPLPLRVTDCGAHGEG